MNEHEHYLLGRILLLANRDISELLLGSVGARSSIAESPPSLCHRHQPGAGTHIGNRDGLSEHQTPAFPLAHQQEHLGKL